MQETNRIKKNITISDLLDKDFFINLPSELVLLPSFGTEGSSIATNKSDIKDINISEKPIDKIYIETWNALPLEYKKSFDNVFFLYATWLDMLPDDTFETLISQIDNKTLTIDFINDNQEYKMIIKSYESKGKNIEALISDLYPGLLPNNQKVIPNKNDAKLSDIFSTIDSNIVKLEQSTIITNDNIILAALSEDELLKLKERTFLYSNITARNLTYQLNNNKVYISILELHE